MHREGRAPDLAIKEMPQADNDGAPPADSAAAVAHWRALSVRDPGQFDRQLATSLIAYAHSQATDGDTIGALATGREALDLWQRLDEATPSFEPQLGIVLFAVSVYLAQLRNVESASAVAEDAVRFWRRACTLDPGRRMQLAEALQLLSARYGQTRMWRQSLTCEREAIVIKRELFSVEAAKTSKAFAKDLDKFVRSLLAFGEAGEAISVAEEAADQWRCLAAEDPGGYTAGHVAALKQLGSLLRERPISAPGSARNGRLVLKEARHIQTARAVRWVAQALGIR